MAKEQKQEQSPPPVPEVPAAAGPPKSFRLYITLGFVSLIVFQMIVLGLLLYSLRQTTPKEEGLDPRNGPGAFNIAPGGTTTLRTKDPTVERQIGDKNTFKIRTSRGDLTDAFTVIMHIKVRKGADERAFDRRYLECTIEIIDSVTSVLEASTTEERREAERTAIKERVKKAINTVLGTPWVQQVLFSEVSHEVT